MVNKLRAGVVWANTDAKFDSPILVVRIWRTAVVYFGIRREFIELNMGVAKKNCVRTITADIVPHGSVVGG